MFKVAAIVQQNMTKINGAVTEKQKIVAITTIVFNLSKTNLPLEFTDLNLIAFNANGISRQRHELTKQLQDQK